MSKFMRNGQELMKKTLSGFLLAISLCQSDSFATFKISQDLRSRNPNRCVALSPWTLSASVVIDRKSPNHCITTRQQSESVELVSLYRTLALSVSLFPSFAHCSNTCTYLHSCEHCLTFPTRGIFCQETQERDNPLSPNTIWKSCVEL